jgi:mRNA interferase MazF
MSAGRHAVVPQRGEVWWVSPDPTQGSKIRKTRPCLVLSANALNRLRSTVVVVPLSTAAQAHPPITVAVRCRQRDAVAVIDQVRAVAKHRLRAKIETASDEDMRNVLAALARVLEMG